jgi:hypothetical protein
MNMGEGFSLFPTTLPLVLGGIMLLSTGVLGWVAWSRSHYRRSIALLELFRLFLVTLVVLTLCQPEWSTLLAPNQAPTLAVLWDRSKSMETRDVLDPEALDGTPLSRAEAIEPLKEASAWLTEEGKDEAPFRVVVDSFASGLDSAEQGTDLNKGLMETLENHANLRGVILLSDGDWNLGDSPVQAAARYRMRKVPIFALGTGSRSPLPDLELLSMDAPTFAVAGKPLRIPFTVGSVLGQERELSVILRVDGEPVTEKVVSVPAMGQVRQSLSWVLSVPGDFKIALEITRDPLDRVLENNRISGPIAVRQEQLKVLLVESYPRWEYRYLRNALERDPGVEVSCLLFHPRLAKLGGGRSYIKQFPSASELNRYDVVFLGDVGVDARQLTPGQAADLKQLVSSQAAGLVFLPGRYGHQQNLQDSALEDLYPVVLDPSRADGTGSISKGHFSLTEAGRRSLLTKLSDIESVNMDIWRRLPGFNWYAGVERAKVGSDILAVHEQDATASGRVPLIVTRTFGTGKVLFMGTDGAWRWREGVEDRYHYRFWGQVARWMAYQRQKAQGKSMRLFCSPDRPRVDDRVTLNANVLDALGGFQDTGSVVVEAFAPSGKLRAVRLQAGEGDARGLFSGSFTPDEPGDYRLVATSKETGASIETDLPVQGWARERTGAVARFDVLEELAAVSEGRVLEINEVDGFRQYLAQMPAPEPVMHRTRLWAHPAWCGILIFLMGLFWVGRKLAGTI